MKIEFKDETSGEVMLSVAGNHDPFIMNIFNLFMTEMVNLHGPTFEKLRTEQIGTCIYVTYTHNITATILPKE